MTCHYRVGQWLLLAVTVWAACSCMHGGVDGAVLPLNGLKLHYYNATCRYAEAFIKHQVKLAWQKDHSITPAILRLVYSDCLVTGCDASILLEGPESEMTAPQNEGLRGFNVINRIKRVMEARCPGVVSCSDILHLAAKEAVALVGAPKYPVFTGRRDGFQSTAGSVDLPSPTVSWNSTLAYFMSKGLDVLDLGTLLGAHSTGVTHCRYIRYRLYNFTGTGQPDDSMDPDVLRQLQKQCPPDNQPGQPDPIVFLTPNSTTNYTFSNSYYTRVLANQGVLAIDQELITTSDGQRLAQQFADSMEDFRKYFAFTMSRMGSLGVLTGSEGEIRRNCSFTNANNPNLK